MARRLLPIALACLVSLWSAQVCRAASAALAIRVNGRAVAAVTPGTRIDVVVHALPPARHAYCLGLASAIDRAGLPVSLGRIVPDPHGTGHLLATIPSRLFPAEPAGPFLLFVGTCTPIAPDRPFLARTIIHIVPR